MGIKRYVTRAMVGLAIATSPACSLLPSSVAPSPSVTSDEALKIGVLLPATGDLSTTGKPMIEVMPLLAEKVNACGGVNNAPVTLIFEDTQTDPEVGMAAMVKLAEVDRVHAVVGASASSVSASAVGVAVRNQVPMISPSSTSPMFTERAEREEFQGYWARTAPPDSYQAAALAQLAIARGYERVSTIAIDNSYGVEFEQAFVKTFEQLGGTVINRNEPTRYDPKATTFDAETAAAFSGEPDAVLVISYTETGSLLLRSAYDQNLTGGVQIMLTDGVQSEDFPAEVGRLPDGRYLLEGAIGTAPAASGAGLDAFMAMWNEKMDIAPSTFVPHTWDAGALIMLAAQAAGTNHGTAIMEQLHRVSGGNGVEVTDVCEGLALLRDGQEINYQGASGNVDLDENGDVLGNYDVWTVTVDGRIEVIDQIQLN